MKVVGHAAIQRSMGEGGPMKIHLALDGEPDISRLWAPTYGMRIGSAVVKMGGIAGVGTNEQYRNRGLARLVMEESTRYFAETEHDVAILFGIPDFYHKFGYAPVLPETTLTVQLKNVTKFGLSESIDHTFRSMKDDDVAGMLELYRTNNQERTGTLVRADDWKGYRHGTEWHCETETTVVVDKDGRLAGYVTFDRVEDVCRIGDLGFRFRSVFPVLIKVMVDQARKKKTEQVAVKLPPDHLFIEYCRGFGSVVQTVYHNNAGGMGRIICLQSLFSKLTRLLSQRVRLSSRANDRCSLQIATNLGAIALDIQNSSVSISNSSAPDFVATIEQMRLMQLVMGYRSVYDVAFDDNVTLPENALPWLNVLFPIGNPWMAVPDWF